VQLRYLRTRERRTTRRLMRNRGTLPAAIIFADPCANPPRSRWQDNESNPRDPRLEAKRYARDHVEYVPEEGQRGRGRPGGGVTWCRRWFPFAARYAAVNGTTSWQERPA